jgi:23S rRNA (cytidine1920-2'-O)/16S rRNA (cytidine1409-2'-O)-methyltransferase
MRQRLDVLVVEKGLLSSREVAQAAIMDGAILVDGKKVTKPGQQIDLLAKLELIPSYKPKRFVSRGGLKLEKALSEFSVQVKDRVCLDVGASSGGFTDCLLQQGARRVYAIDVGYGQFDWKLRNDERVVLKERQNVRYLKREDLYGSPQEEGASLAVVDVSFISLKLILPHCKRLLSEDSAEMICLIKPQFEVGRGSVGKGGVVKSKELHAMAIEQVIQAADDLDLAPLGLTYSPVVGPAGNFEFLLYLGVNHLDKCMSIEKVVGDAHANLLLPKK